MHLPLSLEQFYKRHPYIGPLIWIISAQFFLIQLIVARAWPVPYNIRRHAISDLGNTECGIFNDRYVCSPWFSWMNTSFVFLGFSMMFGSLLLYQQFGRNRGNKLGFVFMGIAGFGTTLVGLFPENVAGTMHAIGAFLPFFIGNIGLLLLGLYLALTPLFKCFTVFIACLSLTAFLLFTTGHYFTLGFGGMERVVAHPQTVWLIIFGLYVSSRMLRHKKPLPHH